MEEYVLELPLCRVCLKSSNECIEMDELIFSDIDDESQTYFECFKACTQLDIQIDDGQSNHICTICSSELCAAYEFITKARLSHEILTAQTFDEVKYEQGSIFIEEEHETYSRTNVDPEIDSKTNESTDKEDDILYIPMEDNDVIEEEVVISSQAEIKYDDVEEVCESNKNLLEQDVQAFDEIVSIDDFHQEEILENDQEVSEAKTKCNLCSKYFTNLNDLKEHGEQYHDRAKFICHICFHRFTFKYGLTDHIKRKHDTSYVKCTICGIFIQRCLMRSHKRKEHLNTQFLCSACPRTFKTSTGLHIHSETHKENRQRNFECEQCNKKFLTERTFKVHTRTHWERKHFKCQLCDKQFLQKINLKLHMQMHRGETMDCMYCEKKFVRKSDLTVHLRFHTGNFPYECPLCDKRFAIVSHLNYHKKRHQGMVYKCEACGKEFINKSGLRNHSFQHTIMPFNCLLCDKGFPTKFKIKRHLKTVHHVEENEDFERLITTDKIKNEPVVGEETIEEEMLEQNVDDQLEEED